MTPLIFESFYHGKDVWIAWLAKTLSSKSPNYAGGALQKNTGGADCFCTSNVPTSVRAVIEKGWGTILSASFPRPSLADAIGAEFWAWHVQPCRAKRAPPA